MNACIPDYLNKAKQYTYIVQEISGVFMKVLSLFVLQ